MSADSDELDRQDMKRLVSGQEAALNDLMDRHGKRLFHYLTRYLGDEVEAEDCLQETFVRVYVHRARFRLDARFSTWLYTIAINRARTLRRARPGAPPEGGSVGDDCLDTLADPAANAAEQVQDRERSEEIRRSVLALPEALRTPLILFEFENLTQAEIGDILGCSRKAVELRIRRAREMLRKTLRPAKGIAA